ncbi:MAG TPA: transcription elongation factor subunit Spt4 [Thermoplasmata archaeon]|nr:transcription elongation factor subunit Spt4 [Thermoplasmata archaeon]
MATLLKACKKCFMLTEEDTCRHCNQPTSKEWQGYLVVADFQKSDIAKRLGIQRNGRFALRVR